MIFALLQKILLNALEQLGNALTLLHRHVELGQTVDELRQGTVGDGARFRGRVCGFLVLVAHLT